MTQWESSIVKNRIMKDDINKMAVSSIYVKSPIMSATQCINKHIINYGPSSLFNKNVDLYDSNYIS